MNPTRILFIAPDGSRCSGRTLEEPRYDAQPTKLLVSKGRRLEVVEAPYSAERAPGTWSRVVEPAP